MRITLTIATALILASSLVGQSTVDSVLAQVELNNTSLSTFRKIIDAEKTGNKTGLYPQNPEVEFNYLWGSPSVIGNRTDISIKQSFDFPSAYRYKNQLSNLKNEQAEMEYKKQRNEILFQTRQICVKLIYQNALRAEMNQRFANAKQIAEAFKTKFSTGEIGILDYNKAQINFLNMSKDLEKIEIEHNVLLSELKSLNGGISIIFNDSVFSWQPVLENFNQWYAQIQTENPLLEWAKYETAISEKQAQLTTAMSWPKFYAGFMSEKVVGEQFQGLTIGISIPLWENKNTGKYARAKIIAAQSMEADTKLKFENELKSTHSKVIALQKSVLDYRTKMSAYMNKDLLFKAFDLGEISLTEYLYELSFYNESMNKLLEMEMNLHLAYTELKWYY